MQRYECNQKRSKSTGVIERKPERFQVQIFIKIFCSDSISTPPQSFA